MSEQGRDEQWRRRVIPVLVALLLAIPLGALRAPLWVILPVGFALSTWATWYRYIAGRQHTKEES